MRILRGLMLGAGMLLVLLASCADQWEPGRILAVGFIGLGLCAAGKLLPEKLPGKKKAAACGANTDSGKEDAYTKHYLHYEGKKEKCQDVSNNT